MATATKKPASKTDVGDLYIEAARIRVVRAVSLAADTEGYRPVLAGMKVTVADGVMTIVSTNSVMLSRATWPANEKTTDGLTALIPAAWLTASLTSLASTKGATRVTVGDGFATIASADEERRGRLITSDYPNVETLLEGALERPDADCITAANPKLLATMLKAGSLIAGNSGAPVRFRTAGELLPMAFSVKNADVTFDTILMPVRVP